MPKRNLDAGGRPGRHPETEKDTCKSGRKFKDRKSKYTIAYRRTTQDRP
jgi:hypothetical protein